MGNSVHEKVTLLLLYCYYYYYYYTDGINIRLILWGNDNIYKCKYVANIFNLLLLLLFSWK